MASSLFCSWTAISDARTSHAASLPYCYNTNTTLQASCTRLLRSTNYFSYSPNRSVHLRPFSSKPHLLLLLCSGTSSNSTAQQLHKDEDGVEYTVMRDDPLSFWKDTGNNLSTSQINEFSSWDTFLEAQIRLVENVARDRASMRSLLMAPRDNWNHLLQRSVIVFLMTATVLAAISGSLSLGISLSLNLPAALLNAGTALIMCVMSHFQPSQLAEEQRTAALLFTRLANDINLTLSLSPELRPEGSSFLEECRERLYALDSAYPMPLTPEGLDKFPKQVKSPVWSILNNSSSSIEQYDDDDDEWTKDLLRTAVLLRSSDEPFYIGWAERMKRLNKALGIIGPLLAMAGGVLNLVGMGSGAALCSVFAGLASSFSHDAQLGMIFEMFRNNAGYYSNIADSIDRSVYAEWNSVDEKERENGQKRKRLIREKVAYQLGRRVKNELSSSSSSSSIVPLNEERAGALF